MLLHHTVQMNVECGLPALCREKLIWTETGVQQDVSGLDFFVGGRSVDDD